MPKGYLIFKPPPRPRRSCKNLPSRSSSQILKFGIALVDQQADLSLAPLQQILYIGFGEDRGRIDERRRALATFILERENRTVSPDFRQIKGITIGDDRIALSKGQRNDPGEGRYADPY